MKNSLLSLRWLVFIVLMLVPPLVLVARSAGNLCFYILIFLSLITIICRLRPTNKYFFQLLKDYWPLHLAMAGMLLAIFANQLLSQNLVIKTYDYPSRMALFFLILWVALFCPFQLMRNMQWAYVTGALFSAVKMYLITKGGTSRAYVDFMPIIEFAQLTLLLGFFSLLSIGYAESNPIIRRVGLVLKLIAACASIYAAYLSQTRGAWIGIPIFLVISVFILYKNVHFSKQIAAVAVLVIMLGVLFGSTHIVQERIAVAGQDMSEYASNANVDTSVGIRLQLWKGSLLLFSRNPVVGVGREGFDAALGDLEKEGVLTHEAAVQPHSHNEILYNMATLGLFGLIGILSLYFVPAYYFFRQVSHPDKEVRITAGMGLILCAGFFILGLVDVMFMWGTSDNFYGLFMAIFFAYIIKRKETLAVE